MHRPRFGKLYATLNQNCRRLDPHTLSKSKLPQPFTAAHAEIVDMREYLPRAWFKYFC